MKHALLAVALTGALVALSACDRSGPSSGAVSGDDWDLAILTPHNDHIQQEFEAAFAKHVGQPLNIRWVKQGTGQIMKTLQATAEADNSFGFDLFFGGGVPDHQAAAKAGYLERPDLPANVLAGIPKDIAGVTNIDPQGLWYGSALSSFGILVNQDALNNQKLPEVSGWADLARPEMYSWVIIADPRQSSSVRVSYELILQQHGWEDGWPMLMAIAANSRQISSSSSKIPNEVAIGNVVAGPCIDFYAFARLAETQGTSLIYVRGSALTPDPVSMLRKPPHRELATRFLAFVLSPEGQRLWFLPAGSADGPERQTLFRMPIRKDVYAMYPDQRVVDDPYEQVGGQFAQMDDELQNRRSPLLAELMGAALVDLHDEARAAWKALIDGGMKPAALAEWRKLPFSEEEGLAIADELEEGSAATRDRTRAWIDQFHAKYEKVRELSQ